MTIKATLTGPFGNVSIAKSFNNPKKPDYDLSYRQNTGNGGSETLEDFKKAVYKILIPLFDALGGIIFFPLRLFKNLPSNPKNILVVRLDHIGDFVCVTPVFKNIKKRFPGAKITALVNSVSKELQAFQIPGNGHCIA